VGAEARGVEIRGDAGDQRVVARGVAAGVEHAADGRAVRLHAAGLEIRRGQQDEHGVDAGEPAQGEALVLDAVLRADEGNVRAGRGAQVIERRRGVLRLHRQQHDIIGGEADRGRVGDGGDGERTESSGVSRIRPRARMASRCAPRAIRMTS
jgi:hypothetical protein